MDLLCSLQSITVIAKDHRTSDKSDKISRGPVNFQRISVLVSGKIPVRVTAMFTDNFVEINFQAAPLK